MTRPDLSHRRCRNHAERQAACRCPGCGMDFCRECVTEHDERLLCARCLAQVKEASATQTGRRILQNVGVGAAGILAAWVFFFLAGELASLMLAPAHEVKVWHAR